MKKLKTLAIAFLLISIATIVARQPPQLDNGGSEKYDYDNHSCHGPGVMCVVVYG